MVVAMNVDTLRDAKPGEWSANDHVEDHAGHTRLTSGFWHTELKLPVTRDLRTCHANHRIYAQFKYDRLISSPEWIGSLDQSLPELSDGILHTGSSSHYHYIIDGIGNLSAEVLQAAEKIFVDSDYSDDQVAFLETVIHSLTTRRINVVRVPPGTYRVANVVLPTARDFPVRVHAARTSVLRLPVRQKLSRQRIYVTRRRAGSRQLINESDFVDMIRNGYGFEIVENEDLGLQAQLELYSGAEFIAGPHGAGLTNIIFSRRPRGVLEFWHSVKQPFFEGLAESLGISYFAASGTPLPGTTQGWRKDNSPFVVDARLVLKAIELLIAKSPRR